MKEKVKVLSINTKRKRKTLKGSADSGMTLAKCMEQFAPGLYTFSEAYVEDAIGAVETLRPEVIWIAQEASKDCSELVKEIKRVHPTAVIFLMFVGLVDDEQEMMEKFYALGTYKCYFLPPLMLDTLAHDMYVALNLEGQNGEAGQR